MLVSAVTCLTSPCGMRFDSCSCPLTPRTDIPSEPPPFSSPRAQPPQGARLGSHSRLHPEDQNMETSAPTATEKKECKGSGLDGSSFSELPKKPSPTTLTR
ncbi:unnamed protein product, partial [Gadus morhua 'NCC']